MFGLGGIKKRIKAEGITQSAFTCERNGLTVRGTEYRPPSKEGARLPVAVVCHGFMAFQDTVRSYAVALAEEGYLSYCFDFCGGSLFFGKSDGRTTDMSVLTEVEDLKAVIAYAKERPYADGDRLTLMGCSQGGLVAALTAAGGAGAKKLVLFYPAFCIPDDARAGKMMMAKFDPADVPETVYCGPMKLGRKYVTDAQNLDPYREIAPFDGKVLIVHGSADGIVKRGYIDRAFATYSARAKGSARLEIIDGGKHMFGKKHDKIALGYLREFVSLNERGKDGAGDR